MQSIKDFFSAPSSKPTVTPSQEKAKAPARERLIQTVSSASTSPRGTTTLPTKVHIGLGMSYPALLPGLSDDGKALVVSQSGKPSPEKDKAYDASDIARHNASRKSTLQAIRLSHGVRKSMDAQPHVWERLGDDILRRLVPSFPSWLFDQGKITLAHLFKIEARFEADEHLHLFAPAVCQEILDGRTTMDVILGMKNKDVLEYARKMTELAKQAEMSS